MKPHVQNWLRQLDNGILKVKTVIVLDYIKRNNITDVYELRYALNMPHQTLTGLLSNIMDEGLVKVIGEREVNGMKYSKLCFVDDADERERVIEARKKIMYHQWLKQGKTRYLNLMSSKLKYAISNEDTSILLDKDFVQTQLF